MRRLFTFAALSATAALVGCNALGTSDTYVCPRGAEEGAHCMSAREIYSATHGSDHVRSPGGSKDAQPAPQAAVAKQAARVPVPAADRPLPVRNPAQVLRGWIAPYEDDRGDLNAGATFFAEIKGRTWTLGEDQVAIVQKNTLRPLDAPKAKPVLQVKGRGQQQPASQEQQDYPADTPLPRPAN